MNKKINFLITILVINFNVLSAQNTEWTVTSSSVKFKIKNAGFNVDGFFTGFKSKINFDAAKSYSNSIEASVDAKTLNTGSSGRDTHLKKDEYFGVDKYPTINLKATLFAKQPNGSFIGYFKLTIKNITKDVPITFTFTEKDNKANIKGSFTINRKDYGVGESSVILADNATITITIDCTKK